MRVSYKKEAGRWRVVTFNGEHNHPLARHSSKYPKARRLGGSMLKIVRNLVLAHAENHTIMAEENGQGNDIASMPSTFMPASH